MPDNENYITINSKEKYSIAIDLDKMMVGEIIVGNWTEYDACAYSIRYIKEILSYFRGRAWSRRVDLNAWVPNDKIVNIIGKHLKWCRTNGNLRYSAYICWSERRQELLKDMLKIGGTEDTSKIFKKVDKANKWLASKGF